MADLPPELQPQVPQAPDTQEATLSPVADVMQQGVQDATGDFITALIRILESKGLDLDDVMRPTVQDQADLAEGGANPAEFLTEEELTLLVEKFEAMEPEVQQQVEEALIKELDPRIVKRLQAIRQFVQGRRA